MVTITIIISHPYSFEPSVSRKLSANPHIDMGQGLLECVRSVHKNEK